MNTDNKQYIRELIEAGEFNGYTLVSGENWKHPRWTISQSSVG